MELNNTPIYCCYYYYSHEMHLAKFGCDNLDNYSKRFL